MHSQRADAEAAFGADLFEVLAADDANLVFSPSSAAGALRMAWLGARGQTAAELARVLHLENPAHLENTADPGGAPGPVPHAQGSAVFRAPNTAWLQSGFAVRPEFTARLSHLAGAVLASADFATAPERARETINAAIAGQTGGKVTGLLPPGAVSALTRLVLASAVYLKAAWADPFGADETDDAPFYPHGPDRPSVAVPVMHGTATRDYLRGDGYQAVLLPYRDIALAMAVLLPDGPLAALRPKVAAAGFAGLLAGAARHRVTLALPRFRLESAFDLIPALRRLGVTEAFGDEADFGGITGTGRLHIDAVAHQAYIDVDEHGTEAAAATAVAIAALAAFQAPPPVTVVVDRPFLFAILDRATGQAVFAGQVSLPRSG
ncbi:MAG TPA: serpin family protein [Streptosporangiaceae bacterium]